MWYPLIDTGFHFGMCCAQNSIMSVTMRNAGVGRTRSTCRCAMYSFRMSFCIVPAALPVGGTPCDSATAM